MSIYGHHEHGGPLALSRGISAFNDFNTDVNGRIFIHSSFFDVVATYRDYRVVVRDGYLWDLDEDTDVFSGSVTLNYRKKLSFEELSSASQNYVTLTASLEMMTDVLGQTSRAVEQKLYKAEADFQTKQLELEPIRLFTEQELEPRP